MDLTADNSKFLNCDSQTYDSVEVAYNGVDYDPISSKSFSVSEKVFATDGSSKIVTYLQDPVTESRKGQPATMAKLVEKFRHAPARSREERELEKSVKKGRTETGATIKYPLLTQESAQPKFSKNREFISSRLSDYSASNQDSDLAGQSRDNLETLNKRIDDLLSASESLSTSSIYTSEEISRKAIEETNPKKMSSVPSRPKMSASEFKDANSRKENDILYQWRLRRKIENARKDTSSHFNNPKRNLDNTEHDGNSLKSKQVVKKTKAEKPFPAESRTDDLDISLSELRAKLRSSNEMGKNIPIVTCVANTLAESPLLSGKSEEKAKGNQGEVRIHQSDSSCQTENIPSGSQRLVAQNPLHQEMPHSSLVGMLQQCTNPQVSSYTCFDPNSSSSCPTFYPFINPLNISPFFYSQYHTAGVLPNHMPYLSSLPTVPHNLSTTSVQNPPLSCSQTLEVPATATVEGCVSSRAIGKSRVPESRHAAQLVPQGSKRISGKQRVTRVPMSSIDSSLTCISSLETSALEESITINSQASANAREIQVRQPIAFVEQEKSKTHHVVSKRPETIKNEKSEKRPLFTSVPKTGADSLMWVKANWQSSKARLKRADMSIHIAAPQTVSSDNFFTALCEASSKDPEIIFEPSSEEKSDAETEVTLSESTEKVASSDTTRDRETLQHSNVVVDNEAERLSEVIDDDKTPSICTEYESESGNEGKSEVVSKCDVETQMSAEDFSHHESRDVAVSCSLDRTELSEATVQTFNESRDQETQTELHHVGDSSSSNATSTCVNSESDTESSKTETVDSLSDSEVEKILHDETLSESDDTVSEKQTAVTGHQRNSSAIVGKCSSDAELLLAYERVCREKTRLEALIKLLESEEAQDE